MTSFKAGRARRVGSLVLALGAVALLALSGLAVARGHHGDRHRHGQDSGQVASFDSGTGMLSIELTGGETVSGLVTGRTEIRCEDEHAPSVSARHGESEPGDDNGGQGEEAGDDNGHGVEPGDDNGGRATSRVTTTAATAPAPARRSPAPAATTTTAPAPTAPSRISSSARPSTRPSWSCENGTATFEKVELAG